MEGFILLFLSIDRNPLFIYNEVKGGIMANLNDDDWELIRQEMENEAIERRFERLKAKHELYNNLFLGLFPKDKRNKVIDIEEKICLLLLAVFTIYIYIGLFSH